MNEQERAAMQQALEALELMVVDVKTTPTAYEAQRQAITALRAALAQEQADGRVVIERRDDMLYMNGSEIGPGTLEIRRDGVTYRAAERVAVQQPEPAQHYASIPGTNVRVRLQPEPVQEPVACHKRRNDPCACSRNSALCDGFGPVQEPAYLEVRCPAHPTWMRVDEQQFVEYVSYGWEGRKLYATPPQRPPLTDEEILRAAINACDSLHITRAIYAGGGRKTICDDAGLLEICRAIERKVRGGKE